VKRQENEQEIEQNQLGGRFVSGETNGKIHAQSQPVHTRSMLKMEGRRFAHDTMHNVQTSLCDGVWRARFNAKRERISAKTITNAIATRYCPR